MSRRTRYEKVRAARRAREREYGGWTTGFQFSSTPHLTMSIDDIPFGFRYLSRRSPGWRPRRGPKRFLGRYCLPRAHPPARTGRAP